jgi:hypothetical protein
MGFEIGLPVNHLAGTTSHGGSAGAHLTVTGDVQLLQALWQ